MITSFGIGTHFISPMGILLNILYKVTGKSSSLTNNMP
jgi:hypothetical protein